jgi:hypothetical protein
MKKIMEKAEATDGEPVKPGDISSDDEIDLYASPAEYRDYGKFINNLPLVTYDGKKVVSQPEKFNHYTGFIYDHFRKSMIKSDFILQEFVNPTPKYLRDGKAYYGKQNDPSSKKRLIKGIIPINENHILVDLNYHPNENNSKMLHEKLLFKKGRIQPEMEYPQVKKDEMAKYKDDQYILYAAISPLTNLLFCMVLIKPTDDDPKKPDDKPDDKHKDDPKKPDKKPDDAKGKDDQKKPDDRDKKEKDDDKTKKKEDDEKKKKEDHD